MRILVGEDERINQLFIRHLLTNAGHEVVVASDGQEVLDAVATARFDLLLLDLHMPEIEGDEAVRRIRSDTSLATPADVPIVAMTALLYDSDKASLYEAGFTDVITKPFEDTTVLELIGRYAKGE